MFHSPFADVICLDSLDLILNRNQDMAIEGENERLAILDQAGAI